MSIISIVRSKHIRLACRPSSWCVGWSWCWLIKKPPAGWEQVCSYKYRPAPPGPLQLTRSVWGLSHAVSGKNKYKTQPSQPPTKSLRLSRYCLVFLLPPRPSWLSTRTGPWLRLTPTMLPPPRSTSQPWPKPVPLWTPTIPTPRTWQCHTWLLLCTTGTAGPAV